MFTLSPSAASLRTSRSGPRRSVTRRPIWDCLDRRELLSTIVLPVGDPPEFAGSMSLPGGGGIASDMHFGAGDLQGTLDNSIALRTYSVDLTVERVPAAVLNATVTTDGTIFGKAIPNAGKYLEFSIEGLDYYPWQTGLFLGDPYRIEGGCAIITDAPGWGIEIDPAFLEKSSYKISELA